MERKVFITVLGTGVYKECSYSKADMIYPKTRFVQEAILQSIHAEEWSEDDKIYILLTDAARKKNWESGIDSITEEKIKGLEEVLRDMHLSCGIEGITIQNGGNENDMWNTFEQLYSLLREEDELFVDLTHGFRYLPMFILVFGNYVKFLKHVTIRSLSYGNFEARVNEIAPIVDLLPLSVLQDWTYASADFLRNGNAAILRELSRHTVSILINKSSVNKDRESLCNLNNFVNILEDVTSSMRLCRGNDILASNKIGRLQEGAKAVESSVISPMKPVVEKIRLSFSDFKPTKDILNGYMSFLWCNEHQLQQQAITILLETMISHFCCKLGKDIHNHDDRNLVSQVVNSLDPVKINRGMEIIENEEFLKAQSLLAEDPLFKVLIPIYNAVNNLRNDINHAGLLEGAAKKNTISKMLETYSGEIKKLLENGFC